MPSHLEAVYRDMAASSKAFAEIVWPKISEMCGGGEIVGCEDTKDGTLAFQLDRVAGIDAWQIIDKPIHLVRGMGIRVQPLEPHHPDYRTFTVRYSRPSGKPTEYQKRKAAIEHGWLYPRVTIQAYTRDGVLVSAAMAHTEEVIQKADPTKRKPNKWGEELIAVPWREFAPDRIKTWPKVET